MAYAAEDRETTIVFGDLDELATVYTCNRPLMTRLAKLESEHPEEYVKVAEDEGNSVTYTIPKNLITLRAPRKKGKKLSPEEREEKRKVFLKRMEKARKEKEDGNKD